MKRLRHTHLPHLGNRKMRDINPQDIERRKVRLLQNKQPATVKRGLGDLRRVFSKAVGWGYLRRSPASTASSCLTLKYNIVVSILVCPISR